jgi:hypothetical protein
MTTQYPSAHLLGLPIELREAIYTYLTTARERQHLKNQTAALHLSAEHTPPLALLQAHPMLYAEALAHFHRTANLTLHVDAYAFAKLRDPNDYMLALQDCHHLRRIRNLELRLTMNAYVDFLVQATKLTVPVLISHCVDLRTVIVTWAETVPNLLSRTWRPWACKSPALDPLWDLMGKVDVKCGGVVNAPPASAELQERGMQRIFDMIGKYKALSDESSRR